MKIAVVRPIDTVARAGAQQGMLVRWRARSSGRFYGRLVEGRRVGGHVRQVDVTMLGTCVVEPTVVQRREFWKTANAALARLANRLTPGETERIIGELHERVPMVSADELHALTIEQADREAAWWGKLAASERDMAGDHDGVAVGAKKRADALRTASQDAQRHADDAKARGDRGRAGEAISESRFTTQVEMLKDIGWTKRQILHARAMAKLSPEEFQAHIKRNAERPELWPRYKDGTRA